MKAKTVFSVDETLDIKISIGQNQILMFWHQCEITIDVQSIDLEDPSKVH